jgi:iron complex transport system substrate-binding protein
VVNQPKTQSTPKRIVSLTPSNTEILFALGLGDKVVGDTSYCDYPPEARKKPHIGDMKVSIEKVVALKPDIVLAHTVLNDDVIHRFGDLNIPVLATDPKTFAEVISEIKRIGAATGARPAAERLAKSMSRSIEDAKESAATVAHPKVLVIIQTSPLWAAGPKTFVDEMISFSDSENVARDGKPGFSTFSMETAIARNPDVIVVTRPEDKAYLERNSLWTRTSAVKRGRVLVIDPDLMFRPGPRLTEGLWAMVDAVKGRKTR